MSESWQDRRQFDRYDIHYEVDIYDDPDDEPIERTQLRNLSGGGVCFLSRRPECYSIGQRIIVVVCLPHINQLSFRMKGEGRVVRIGKTDKATGRADIGVLMIEPLLCEDEAKC